MTPRSHPYGLVQLANGSWSVRSAAHQETFHPVIGPAAEAEVLYARQLRLPERFARHTERLVVWDVGLGAAANALAVLREAETLACPLQILSFDHTLEPLAFALGHAAALGYFGGYLEAARRLVAEGDVVLEQPGRQVHWRFCPGDFPERMRGCAPLPAPDAILYDPFSMAKNPAMWTLAVLTAVHGRLDPARACVLATYSRSTILRVTLLLAGFYVGAGRATGEKEETTVAANALALLERPLDRNWLARARRSTSAEPLHEPVYRQDRLAPETWDRLVGHPQFRHATGG